MDKSQVHAAIMRLDILGAEINAGITALEEMLDATGDKIEEYSELYEKLEPELTRMEIRSRIIPPSEIRRIIGVKKTNSGTRKG